MKIGFIGLGNVGHMLAGSLLRNGFDFTVRDVDQSTAESLLENGALWGIDGKSITETCDVIITCLLSPCFPEELIDHQSEVTDLEFLIKR